MKRTLMTTLAMVLAGCMPQAEADGCGAAELQALVGQDRQVLATMRFADPVRILSFGQPMTMDFNPERLNIQMDQSGKIDKIWCG